jgi:hypothetical protein
VGLFFFAWSGSLNRPDRFRKHCAETLIMRLSAYSSTHNLRAFRERGRQGIIKDREGISAPLKSQLDQRYIVVDQI